MFHLLFQTFWSLKNGKILCISHFILFWILWNLDLGIFEPNFEFWAWNWINVAYSSWFVFHSLLQAFWPLQNWKILFISHFIQFWIWWNLVFGIFWHKFWNLGLELKLYCPLKLICVPFIVANILAFTELKNIMYSWFYTILNFFEIWFMTFLGLNLDLELNLYCPLKLICVPFNVAHILNLKRLKNIM